MSGFRGVLENSNEKPVQYILMETKNKVLMAVDVSNFEYVAINSAFSYWREKYRDDAYFIKSIKETDQKNLPNILTSNSFKKVLHNEVQSRFETLQWIAKSNHQMELDVADSIDMFLMEDGKLNGNFRKILYPEYKAQRKLILHSFNLPLVKEYVQNIIFKDLEVETKLGYKLLKVENCESDDLIAVLMKRFNDYSCKIIISSDRDFLQLENVHQYDMWGKKIEIGVKNHPEYEMTNKEFLHWKILRGDLSDNIKNVFPKIGEVKSYKLIKNKPLLKQMLLENQEAANRYVLNKKLIDFNEIPKETEEQIYNAILGKLNEKTQKEMIEDFNLKSCMML